MLFGILVLLTSRIGIFALAVTAPADKASIELYPFANITFLVLGYDSSAMAKAVLNLS